MPSKCWYSTCEFFSAPKCCSMQRQKCVTLPVCAAAQVRRQSENVSACKSSRGGYHAKVCAAALCGCAQEIEFHVDELVCVCEDSPMKRFKNPTHSYSLSWLVSIYNMWIYKEIICLRISLDNSDLTTDESRHNNRQKSTGKQTGLLRGKKVHLNVCERSRSNCIIHGLCRWDTYAYGCMKRGFYLQGCWIINSCRVFKTPERGWGSRMDRSPAGQKRATPPEATPSLLKSSRLLPWQHYVSAGARTPGCVTMDRHAASANSWSHCCILQGGTRRGHCFVWMGSSRRYCSRTG